MLGGLCTKSLRKSVFDASAVARIRPGYALIRPTARLAFATDSAQGRAVGEPTSGGRVSRARPSPAVGFRWRRAPRGCASPARQPTRRAAWRRARPPAAGPLACEGGRARACARARRSSSTSLLALAPRLECLPEWGWSVAPRIKHMAHAPPRFRSASQSTTSS